MTTESLANIQGEKEKRKHAEILLRKENATQKALKEKFVVVYEALFNGEDPSAGNPNFWGEVLLLKVNANVLERLIILTSEEDILVNLKGNISMIFVECTKALADTYPVRQQHALETLSVLMRSIFRKRFNNFGGDVTNILCGSMDKADLIFTDLLRSIQIILETKGLNVAGVIQLLLVIVTAVDNINQNTLFEYFLKVDLFPTFTKVVLEGSIGLENEFHLLILVVILANYQKHEANNPYLAHLQNLDNPILLKAISNILSEVMAHVNRENTASPTQDPSAGMWNKLGSYVSSFIYKPASDINSASNGYAAGPGLLVIYTLIYLNPSFAKSLAPPRVPASPRSALPPSPSSSPRGAEHNKAVSTRGPIEPLSAGVALVQQFLTFCSYIFVDCSNVRAHTYSKLCLLILTCISETNTLEDFFHDPNFTGSFTYSKLTGPVDKAVLTNVQPQAGQGLACVVLDTVNLFMKQNMKKKFDLDLYKRCVGIVHRILGYEKKTATRLAYKWKDMWNTLFSVMRQSIGAPIEQGILGGPSGPAGSLATGGNGGVAVGNEVGDVAEGTGTVGPRGSGSGGGGGGLSKQQLSICLQVVTVLNLFITYGDSFLPSPSDYDDLYYEIMRVSKMLEHFYSIAEKYEHSQDTPLQQANTTLNTDTDGCGSVDAHGLATLSMLNIKTIITHFSGKIQQWTFAHPEVTLTPDMVLKIIKDNYDSLKLKLQENLDYFEPYIETTETPYFRSLTRFVVQDLKLHLT
eukprot:Phypoly_transcript_03907.p1 GENE.Phypoly_transcript_03907~~Phypoly_transcript_03907.p1  ORF type:complete len:759 (+),score=84.53 Phypoly_transcript_03907:28-2277(+)